MISYEKPINNIYDILAQFQMELEKDYMIGQDVLEIVVTPRFFERLKLELSKKNVINYFGTKRFMGSPAEVEEFNNWTDTELHLPCGKVIVRCE